MSAELIARWHRWENTRADLSVLEDSGGPPASDWQNSDDEAVELLDRAMDQLVKIHHALDALDASWKWTPRHLNATGRARAVDDIAHVLDRTVPTVRANAPELRPDEHADSRADRATEQVAP